MADGGNYLHVRRIRPGGADRNAALHLAFDLPPPTGSDPPRTQVADLLANAERRSASIDLLFGIYRGDRLVGATLAVESPGAAAMVFVSGRRSSGERANAAVSSLRALQEAAWNRGIQLLEVLLPPNSAIVAESLKAARFRYLTRLLYLRRSTDKAAPLPGTAHDLTWVSCTPEKAGIFCDAIERTYVQSLDCPELTGLRSTEDVLASHRAVGAHDPSLWWVAIRDAEPVGVMLLSWILGRTALEIVYMGVAQPARGAGVGDALMARAVDAARRPGVRCLALAVDRRNTAARRLYARWDFEETGVRDAWIATPPQESA